MLMHYTKTFVKINFGYRCEIIHLSISFILVYNMNLHYVNLIKTTYLHVYMIWVLLYTCVPEISFG